MSCIDDDEDGFGYRPLRGTSMATPTVTGLVALLMQDYRSQYPDRDDPTNATVKMFLAQSAADIGNAGPDYQSGYGSVRIRDAIEFMRAGRFYEAEAAQAEGDTYMVQVDAGVAELKITLVWDDAPGHTPT